MQPTPNGPRVSVQVPALWVAILSVVVLSVVICVNAYVIYLTAYVGCSAILNKPVARWKRRLMRLYLLAVMVLWLLEIVYQVGTFDSTRALPPGGFVSTYRSHSAHIQTHSTRHTHTHARTQVEVRRSAASLPGSTRSFFLSITWIMITFVGHIFFFGVFSVAAISNLNSSAEVGPRRGMNDRFSTSCCCRGPPMLLTPFLSFHPLSFPSRRPISIWRPTRWLSCDPWQCGPSSTSHSPSCCISLSGWPRSSGRWTCKSMWCVSHKYVIRTLSQIKPLAVAFPLTCAA